MPSAKKAAPRRRGPGRRAFRRLLVPLDFTKRDGPTVETALLIAKASGAVTTLLHVVYVATAASLDPLKSLYADLIEKARAKLDRHARRFRRQGLAVEVEVRLGSPRAEILDLAQRQATDLIVLSSHAVEPTDEAGGGDGLSYRIATLCRCPVLLAK